MAHIVGSNSDFFAHTTLHQPLRTKHKEQEPSAPGVQAIAPTANRTPYSFSNAMLQGAQHTNDHNFYPKTKELTSGRRVRTNKWNKLLHSSRGRKGSTKSSYMQTGLPPGKCQKAKAHRRRPKSSYGRIGLVADAAESGIRKLPSGFAGDAAAGAAGPDGCGCPSCTASGVRMREKIWQK